MSYQCTGIMRTAVITLLLALFALTHVQAKAKRGKQWRPLTDYACLVEDSFGGNRSRPCKGRSSECSLGPLSMTMDDGSVDLTFCSVRSLSAGVLRQACLIKNDTVTFRERRCPRNGNCSLGPVAVNDADAFFCAENERQDTREDVSRPHTGERDGDSRKPHSREDDATRHHTGERDGDSRKPHSREDDVTREVGSMETQKDASKSGSKEKEQKDKKPGRGRGQGRG